MKLTKKIRAKAQDALERKEVRISSFLPFLGPAFLAAVGYIDPGNFASNLQSGAQFGYLLIWVLILANFMGMFLQILSAKLGVATGKNLAELCKEHFSKPISYLLWVIVEIIFIATDVAEFVGAALGFHLLFSIPLFWGGILTAVFTFLFLSLERKGFRPLELVIAGFVGLIVLAFGVEIFFADPNPKEILNGLIPRFKGKDSLWLSAAIIGATIMPHVIFLHSALTQNRIRGRTSKERKRLYYFQVVDVFAALSIAGLINLSMLILAAAVFHSQGLFTIYDIEPVYKALDQYVGKYSNEIFGVALLASGISSSVVGTLSGQIIMQSFVNFPIPLFLRRFITILPSLIILGGGVNPTKAMVFSQIVLCFGIPFALLPLLYFTMQKRVMTDLVNTSITNIFAFLIILLIVTLNGFLIALIF